MCVNLKLQENGTLSPRGQRVAAGARVISLDFTQSHTVASAPRDNVSSAPFTGHIFIEFVVAASY